MKTRFVKQAAAVAIPALVILLLATDRSTIASFEQQTAPPQDKTVEQVYKNIQIFNGLPAAGLMRGMDFFSKSLGVDCTYCHVENEFEKDDKPAKQTARKMLRLTGTIYREIYEGKDSPVNCYTCHRGKTEIVSVPSQEKPSQ